MVLPVVKRMNRKFSWQHENFFFARIAMIIFDEILIDPVSQLNYSGYLIYINQKQKNLLYSKQTNQMSRSTISWDTSKQSLKFISNNVLYL
jgi:hypothetical protein